MKSALYHQTGKQPIACAIAKKNPNGTVDLAIDGVVKITECEVSKDAAPGTCTLLEDEDPKAELKAAAKAARAKAVQLAKAAVNARRAADAAQNKPNHAELLKAVEEAEAAAKQAETESDAAEEAAK